jgi:15-cis-phytoene synthase
VDPGRTEEALTRAELVEAARLSIARGSKSFAAASRLFDPATRERAWLLYAWCRRCDDIADGQEGGGELTPVADPLARVAGLARLTDAALAGEVTGEPAFDALGLVARETGLPHRWPRDLVDGFRLDAQGWRPASEADLYRYCYHVAGVVGCMMALVMGVSPGDEATLDRACDLGMAFQLANIARDLAEDARGGRCYLPGEWLAEMGLTPGDLLDPRRREEVAVLARRLAEAAGRFEASARAGTPALPPRSAWAVLAAANIYGAIGREVARRGADALERRVVTSAAAKAGFIATAGWQALRRASLYPPQPRDPSLWQRPRSG